MLKRLLSRWWSYHPAEGLNLDDPETTAFRRGIIHRNRFLEKIYREWYDRICGLLPERRENVVELGSGAGFLEQYLPGSIRTEVFFLPGLSLVLDARHLPFREACLDGIVMVDVLHHIPDVRLFFDEADRCLRPGGAVVMHEPWRTAWSGWVYRNLHHEPFEPAAADWRIPAGGPLSGANGALPWIVFERDREEFCRSYPRLKPVAVELLMPFRYLISGGMTFKAFSPAFSFGLFKTIENLLRPLFGFLAMFAIVKIVKLDAE